MTVRRRFPARSPWFLLLSYFVSALLHRTTGRYFVGNFSDWNKWNSWTNYILNCVYWFRTDFSRRNNGLGRIWFRLGGSRNLQTLNRVEVKSILFNPTFKRQQFEKLITYDQCKDSDKCQRKFHFHILRFHNCNCRNWCYSVKSVSYLYWFCPNNVLKCHHSLKLGSWIQLISKQWNKMAFLIRNNVIIIHIKNCPISLNDECQTNRFLETMNLIRKKTSVDS